MKIKPSDPTVAIKSGVKDGRPWEIKEQHAFIELNGERRRIVVPVSKFREPYAAGKYTLDLGAHLRVGKYGNLQLDDRIALVPVAAPAKA